jgi:hypothetical protein
MSEFEYVAVLVSLILGLGITRLLAGVGRAIHRRETSRVDLLHSVWTAAVFWTLILNWWVFFESRSLPVWSFGYFVVVIIWAVLFYLMTVVLYPPDIGATEAYGALFERNRRWFLGLFVASSLSDIWLTALRGDLLDPPQYLPFALHMAVLGVLAMIFRAPRFQLALATYVLAVGLTWSLLVRRLLGG